ncbi:MAG: hypothetical protein K6E21_03855 [Bacilli bacterium]|nr:hypothetical protein [Bacilli bacterium]
MGIFIAILWLILAFVVASLAKKRGRSYAGWLILSLIISPIITGLIVLLLGEKK